MQIRDLVALRHDLLFQGAVQIGWYETDPERAQKAAENFVFHGPKYHGVHEKDFRRSQTYRLKDTVNFTLDVLRGLGSDGPNVAPIMLAAAGYGTGKSHLGLTLAVLLSGDFEGSREKILKNLKDADEELGLQIHFLLEQNPGPYLVVTINGMEDLNLAEEIRRQVLSQLRKRGFSTEVLDRLRPRFQSARTFTEKFFDLIPGEFYQHFAEGSTKEEILKRLESHDEEAFQRVNAIYKAMMEQDLFLAGRESLQDFLSTLSREYCGRQKPFQGVVILFDEFGRYLEFAVHKPHIAGPEGLQQLFESVQNNTDSIFLLCFIQSELRAYVSRVAPELRDRLERFVTRYETVPKFRLSTNLETIMANLIQKQDLPSILKILRNRESFEHPEALMQKMQRWFPHMRDHALWIDPNRFAKVIQEGCWPLHPMTTWILYHLTAVGKSFQQRSALSLLDDVFRNHESQSMDGTYWSIPPVALCTDGLIAEFKTFEEFGNTDAIAYAFEQARSRFENELREIEEKALKAVLLATKTGMSVSSEKDFTDAATVLTGEKFGELERAFQQLVKEYGILKWNEALRRYDIVDDAVPKRVFLRFLDQRVQRVSSVRRADLFRERVGTWLEFKRLETDFGRKKDIYTAEWHFAVSFTNVEKLAEDVDRALQSWMNSYAVDQYRGQALLCYVGPESNLGEVLEVARKTVAHALNRLKYIGHQEVPLAVVLVHDDDGSLGKDLAEYYLLEQESDQETFSRFSAFIPDHKSDRLKRIRRAIEQFVHTTRPPQCVAGCSAGVSGNGAKEIFESIFSRVYPELVPFPFDGFHTARGNAAKDCMQFIRELFLGNLNQTAISAYAPQQRNRAVTVLDKTWKIFLPDGTVSRRPGNPRISKLIDHLDRLLQTSGRLNVGEAIRILCGPPSGCNLASAGLVLGVFFSPRRDEIRLYHRGQIRSPEEWLGLAVQGNYFNLNELDETDFELVRVEESDFWKDFLANWELEATYEGKWALYEKAVVLAETQPVPPGLRDRWELRRRDAEEAKKHLDRYEKTLVEQRGYAHKAYERGHSGNLARCACTLLDLLERMRENDRGWTQEQMEVVRDELASFKVGALQHFEAWLNQQDEIDPMKYSEFQYKMTKAAESFERLGLLKEAQRVREQHDKVKAELDNRQRLRTICEEVETFLAGVRIGASSKVLELQNILKRISQLELKIKEAFQLRISVMKLNETWERAQKLKKSCEAQLKAHKERAEAIWQQQLNSIDDVRQTEQEVRALITLYDGLEADLADFRIMHRVLTLVEENYEHMNSLAISASELEQRYERAIQNVKGVLKEDDEIPWSIEETFTKLKEKIEKKRREKAQEWMKQNVPTLDRITTMRAEEIKHFRRQLNTPPPYLAHQDLDKVRLTLEACSKRLDDLEVEGLVARFEELSLEAQREFLRRVLQIADREPFRMARRG